MELAKARKETLKVRINLKTKHDKDISKAKKVKHYVAQILTMLKELETSDTKNPKSEIPARTRQNDSVGLAGSGGRNPKKTEKQKKEETK